MLPSMTPYVGTNDGILSVEIIQKTPPLLKKKENINK